MYDPPETAPSGGISGSEGGMVHDSRARRFRRRWWLLGALTLAGCAAEDEGSEPPGPSPPATPLPSYDCLIDRDCSGRMVAAHRGYHLVEPENSLAAIRAAGELGASFAEIDVRHTADDVLVLMHDDTVDRTTDGNGAVEAMSYADLAELRLLGGAADDEEATQVPRFAEALALAQEIGLMLYVDQKTDRTDLVAETIAEGPYHEVALVRDSLASLVALHQLDPEVLVMPAVESESELGDARAQIDGLLIVELVAVSPNGAFTAAAGQVGVKVQQDVMVGGDVVAFSGDYRGYQDFVDAGVALMQTDLPELLVPAVRELNDSGVFPAEGPGRP